MKASKALRYIRRLLELLSLTGAITLVALYAQTAALLPKPFVPYNAEPGLVSEFGMGSILTALFALGIGIMGLLIMLSRFPKLYRAPVPLNANNIEIQYVLSKIMLSSLQIICAMYFSILIIQVYKMEIQIDSSNFKNLTVSALIVCVAIYLSYLYAARKQK